MKAPILQHRKVILAPAKFVKKDPKPFEMKDGKEWLEKVVDKARKMGK